MTLVCWIFAFSFCYSTVLAIEGSWKIWEGSEYFIGSERTDWTSAQNICKRLNSTLAIITGSEENNYLTRFISDNNDFKKSDRWIGLRRLCPPCDSWIWHDGTSIIYEKWNDDEPDNDNCGRLTASGWADYSCTTEMRYICERDVNECEYLESLCLNGATCENTFGGYDCLCTQGWEGDNCTQNINECLDKPCANNATCKDVQGSYQCNCVMGFSGMNCETDLNECEYPEPLCLNGATCDNTFGSYDCLCAQGWEGDNCTQNINECLDNPCSNNATCKDVQGSYQCNCVMGFSGMNCETEIDECLSMPCHNSGKCYDQINGYMCNCSSRYYGTLCQNELVNVQNPSGLLKNVRREDLVISLSVGAVLAVILLTVVAVLTVMDIRNRPRSNDRTE